MPVAAEPQGLYMVTSGKHISSGCCYDCGDAEVSRTYVTGPWVMADLEGGIVEKPAFEMGVFKLYEF